jgi:hypothetical protein
MEDDTFILNEAQQFCYCEDVEGNATDEDEDWIKCSNCVQWYHLLALVGNVKRTTDVSILWLLLAIEFCSMDSLTILGFAFNVGNAKRRRVWKSQSF